MRQGQELLITHALNWKLAIASRVISTLSHLHSLGQRFENIGPVIRDFVTSGDGICTPSVGHGFDSMVTDLNKCLEYLFETKLMCNQFVSTSGFEAVLAELEGDIKALEMQDASLSAQLSQALEDTVNTATNLFIHHLGCGLVLAVSLALERMGRRAPAVEGEVVMNLVKNGIKKASEMAAGKAQQEILTLGTDQDDKVAPIIKKRTQTIMDLSMLSADVAILHVLLQSVNDISGNTKKLSDTLAAISNHVSDKVKKIYTIKLLVQDNGNVTALAMLDASLADWMSIASGADIMEQTFVASC